MSGSRHAGPGRHGRPPAGPAEAGAAPPPIPAWALWEAGDMDGMWMAAGVVTCCFGLHPRLAGPWARVCEHLVLRHPQTPVLATCPGTMSFLSLAPGHLQTGEGWVTSLATLARSEPGLGLWRNRSQAIPPCYALRTTAPCPSSTAGRHLCQPGSSSGNSQTAVRQRGLPRDPASHQKAYSVQGQPSPPTPLLLASSSWRAAPPPTQRSLLCWRSPAGPALRYQWPCVCPSAWWFPTTWSRLGVTDSGPVPPRLSGLLIQVLWVFL